MLLKKISLEKCLLNKLLKLNRGCLGSKSYIFLKLIIFMTKQKSLKVNLQVNDLMVKMLQKAMYLDSFDQAKSQNLTPKCQILNVFWITFRRFSHHLDHISHVFRAIWKNKIFDVWLEVKGGIFSIGFQTSKILFIPMALKTCEMWSKWHLNSHFFQKFTKNRPTGGCFAPRLP